MIDCREYCANDQSNFKDSFHYSASTSGFYKMVNFHANPLFFKGGRIENYRVAHTPKRKLIFKFEFNLVNRTSHLEH
jgi:hypothetical protein